MEKIYNVNDCLCFQTNNKPLFPTETFTSQFIFRLPPTKPITIHQKAMFTFWMSAAIFWLLIQVSVINILHLGIIFWFVFFLTAFIGFYLYTAEYTRPIFILDSLCFEIPFNIKMVDLMRLKNVYTDDAQRCYYFMHNFPCLKLKIITDL